MAKRMTRQFRWVLPAVLCASLGLAQQEPSAAGIQAPTMHAGRYSRWILVLEDPPLAAKFPSRSALSARAAAAEADRLAAKQQALRETLALRPVAVDGASSTLLNALFVIAPASEAAQLSKLPGVARVFPDLPIRRAMNQALPLISADRAWTRIGGSANAGRGVRIAILDTGIDVTHPAFQDQTLSPPSGFPKCNAIAGEWQCSAFTNRKVIVARSYVPWLELGDEPDYSRPDDRTPRDRVGHGTAVAMAAAGATVAGPLGTMSGVAPGAFLGNYKIFGSPGVNDFTFTSVLARAMEDAVADGMDIVNLSLSFPALWGPLDSGSTCWEAAGVPCDPRADLVRNLVRLGVTVVVPAGNEGDAGLYVPSLGTVQTPGTAPEVITVGATTNAHVLFHRVGLVDASAPASLRNIPALMGNGRRPRDPVTASAVSVVSLGNDGLLCSPLPPGSLNGKIAVFQRGSCTFAEKMFYAQSAGAVAGLMYQSANGGDLFPPQGLEGTGIPLFFIGYQEGTALRDYLLQNSGAVMTLDPGILEEYAFDYADWVADFSSYGPAIGTGGVKPELVAPGTYVLTAAQDYDPNGELFSPARYVAAMGTSLSTPLVSGAVAAVLGQRPEWRGMPERLKSAVVNTATLEHVDEIDEYGQLISPARVVAVGAGKLDVNAAVQSTLTVFPATLSFGDLTANNFSLAPSLTLQVTNGGPGPVNVALSASGQASRISFDVSSFTLAAGATRNVTVRITGSKPAAGSYEGDVLVSGGSVPLRVPFLFTIGDRIPYNVIPLGNFDFEGEAGEQLLGGLPLKVVDEFGAPVPGVRVIYSVTSGGGHFVINTGTAQNPVWSAVTSFQTTTDSLGIAEATYVYLGGAGSLQAFTAEVQGLGTALTFLGLARPKPTVTPEGVVNAADGSSGGLQPGSYISIYGLNLADTVQAYSTEYLPLSVARVSVSFDETYIPDSSRPSGFRNDGLSLPGRIHFVSPGQINVQIPWEFMGKERAYLKVSIGNVSSGVIPVQLSRQSPGVFLYQDSGSGESMAAALDSQYRLIGPGNPAPRTGLDRDFIQIYCNGLGEVTATPPSGEITPLSPLAWTRNVPVVTVGGRPARVLFHGLAPNNVGLYQLNVVLDASTPSGKQPVVVTVNGVSSKPANLMVQ